MTLLDVPLRRSNLPNRIVEGGLLDEDSRRPSAEIQHFLSNAFRQAADFGIDDIESEQAVWSKMFLSVEDRTASHPA
jgi:hypothetical protein